MAHTLTDHDSIRRWAEQTGARPVHVKGTGGGDDPGVLRLDFEGYSGGDSLEDISWANWFEKFDERGLALIVDDTGERPNFNKLVRRGTDVRPRAAEADEDEDDLEDVDDDDDEFDDDDEESEGEDEDEK